MRDVGLHAQKRGWARDVTWIVVDGSPGTGSLHDVKDGGCEGNCAGLPRRDLRAVPWEFCVIKKTDYEPI